jgi:hypothetical protein
MQHALVKELGPGEEVVWCAQPRPEALGRHLHATRRFAYFFGIFGGFGLFMTVVIASLVLVGVKIPVNGRTATSHDAWVLLFLPLWSLGFIAGGRFMWKGPDRASKAAAFTAYALTTTRLIIFSSNSKGSSRKIRKFDARDLDRIVRIERPGDEGDLILGEEPEEEFAGIPAGNGPPMRPVGLLGIDQPADVERLIRATLPRQT